MKKLWSVILVLCLLLGLTACGKTKNENDDKTEPPAFENEEVFISHVESKPWLCEYTEGDISYYRIRLFSTNEGKHQVVAYDLQTDSGENLEDMVRRMVITVNQKGGAISWEDDVWEVLEKTKHHYNTCTEHSTVTYDWEAGLVKDGDIVWDFTFDTLMESDTLFYFQDESLTKLSNAWDSLKKADKKSAFLSDYPNAVTAKDVRYDIYANLGKNFVLEGTVKLDDYFNYDYRNLDSIYFCMHVTPTGGSAYTDQWYIYASRSDFKDLKDLLMEKDLSDVTLVCRADFVDDGKNRMATLVDYYIG